MARDSKHCILNIQSFPGLSREGICTFVTDGSYILFGTEEPLCGDGNSGLANLAIFEIVNANLTIIPADQLLQWKWPKPKPDPSDLDPHWTSYIKNIAFHSGLLVFTEKQSNTCVCFKIVNGSTLDRFYPESFLDQCYDIRNITINKEYICIEVPTYPDKQNKLLLFDRNFVLQGKTESKDDIKQLIIQGRYIIAFTKANSIEFWCINEMKIEHIKSTSREVPDFYSEYALITQSQDHISGIIYTIPCFYIEDEQIAMVDLLPDINREKNERQNGGCLDVLSSRYFATFTQTKEKIKENNTTIRCFDFEITDLHLGNKKKLILTVPSDFKKILHCEMYFSTIIMIFENGILRVKVAEDTDIYREKALNSSGGTVITNFLNTC